MLLDSKDVKISKISEKNNVGVFVFEPLPQTYGHTFGSTLRRVLLTSLEGAAVTQVKFDGVVHQFSTVPGVKEDVVELGLNFKNIRAKMHIGSLIVARINKKGPGAVTAADIETDSSLEILNKDLHLATLADKNSTLSAELVFELGVGYSPIEDRETSKIGVILLDAFFSPVTSANYMVEPTRLGRKIGLDKLILTITTDGSVTPDRALAKAATTLSAFFGRFSEGEDKKDEEMGQGSSGVAGAHEDVLLEELSLPTRTINALRKQNIETLQQLARKSDEELSDIKNLGEKSVGEIKKLLVKEGLR